MTRQNFRFKSAQNKLFFTQKSTFSEISILKHFLELFYIHTSKTIKNQYKLFLSTTMKELELFERSF